MWDLQPYEYIFIISNYSEALYKRTNELFLKMVKPNIFIF